MNSYELSRKWFDWCFDNPDTVKPNHTALYFFCIEHCNRLGWQEKFGLPTEMAKSAIGIHSYNTYIKTLNDLVEFGFIKLITKSKNQFSSNIVGLSFFDKATTEALDKAIVKHVTKHSTKRSESTGESISSINKPITDTETNNKQTAFINFKTSLKILGASDNLISEWIKIRKAKKLVDTETAFNGFKAQFEKTGKPIDEVLKRCIERSWGGFEAEWIIEKGGAQGETSEQRTARLSKWRN